MGVLAGRKTKDEGRRLLRLLLSTLRGRLEILPLVSRAREQPLVRWLGPPRLQGAPLHAAVEGIATLLTVADVVPGVVGDINVVLSVKRSHCQRITRNGLNR